MKATAFGKKWHLTDNVKGLCPRVFDKETGKIHVKNLSEKWSWSLFFFFFLSL